MTITSEQLILGDILSFTATGPHRLRWYQLECARAIVSSVWQRRGQVFTVMFAQQMGKSETSAQIEAYLLALYAARGGSMVKAAPSFQPGAFHSMLRLKGILEGNPVTCGRWGASDGSTIGLGDASITFCSAHPRARAARATASLLLEIDEAQDVDPDKYDRDFRPMAAGTNATTVLYGASWCEDSILERQRRENLVHELRTGERLHFEHDWQALAALSPAYGEYVRAEMGRLGRDHPIIRAQYLLECLDDAGRLFSAEQQVAISGTHPRQHGPRPGAIYVAGIDLGGEDERANDALSRILSPRRGSTVVTIAELDRDASGAPAARVVDHIWWTGRSHVRQLEQFTALWRRWRFTRVSVDASGIGAGIAGFLAERFGERVDRVVFSAPVKSALAWTMLGMAGSRRLSIYADDGSDELRECRRQIRLCCYRLRDHEQVQWEVPAAEGHDDFVVSLALCCWAAELAARQLLDALP